MLVVLLIMGLLVGLVSVSVRPDDRGQLQAEAERLAQLLNLATAESRLTGKSIRWITDGTGYRFSRLRADGAWSEIRDDDLFRVRTLPPGMTISGLRVEAMHQPGAMRLEFVPYGPPLLFTVDMTLGPEHLQVTSSALGEAGVRPGTGDANASLALQ